MPKNKVITPDMVDWNAYKCSVEQSIANETIWGLGGSEFAEENIEKLEEELYLIENEDYDELFSKYDDDVWRDYLK
jgi:hypothetical protein